MSRGVVVEAYSQLVAEGYLVARSGDGTRVADGLAQQPPAPRAPSGTVPRIRYDLRSGIPDVSYFPRREWQSATATVLRVTLHDDCSVTVPLGPALVLGYGRTAESAIPRAVRELAAAAGH